MREKDDAIGFRVPAALKRALEAAAEAEHRSLGQLCTFVLMKYLEERGEWRIGAPPGVRGRADRGKRGRRSGSA